MRREIAKARRQETEAINHSLEMQRNILVLSESIGNLFPGNKSSPAADVGNKAAIVLNDKLDLSGKLAAKIDGQMGEMLGGSREA